jgi:hypothetical protein
MLLMPLMRLTPPVWTGALAPGTPLLADLASRTQGSNA